MSKIVNCLIIILQRGNFSLQVLVYFFMTLKHFLLNFQTEFKHR